MKKNILVLFGGKSSEHDVSLRSATTIFKYIDKEKFDVYPVGITKDGKWLLYTDDILNISDELLEKNGIPAILSPDSIDKSLIIFNKDILKIKIDVVLPVLHGKNGEDGTIQGLCELASIPYVGCGVLASSVSMDKAFTKICVAKKNIPQAKYVIVKKEQLKNVNELLKTIESSLPYPYFIKPACSGSSVGISKAHNKDELLKGLNDAFKYDKKVLVEETIIGREVETAVLGNNEVIVSGVGEIIKDTEFYDYDAKYNSKKINTVVDAKLDEFIKEKIRSYAKEIFEAIDGKGLARIDFFVKDNGEIVFNEINTFPGFTTISMYPMLFNAIGYTTKELITKLIELAVL